MTVIAFEVMIFSMNFFSQFKINIATPGNRTSIFSCYMIMISYFIIFCSKQFITYPAFITWFKTSFIFYRHNKIFIKMIFCYFFVVSIFFENCFNKFIDCIFSSLKTNWLAKSIIYTYKVLSKISWNVFLIIFWCKRHYYHYHYFELLLQQIQNQDKS